MIVGMREFFFRVWMSKEVKGEGGKEKRKGGWATTLRNTSTSLGVLV